MTAPLQHPAGPSLYSPVGQKQRLLPVSKVIASDVRKGNVLEGEDGKLYTVLKSETYRPGKGTPTATIEMRRISDGVKVVETYKTTDSLERAFVEEVKHTYLYQDGDHY